MARQQQPQQRTQVKKPPWFSRRKVWAWNWASRDAGSTESLAADSQLGNLLERFEHMPLTPTLPPWLDSATSLHLQDVITTLLSRHGDRILAIILYGSLARHDERPSDDRHPSDVDLLLILDTDERISPEEHSAIFHSLGLAHMRHLYAPREISPMLSTRTLADWDPTFIANVARDGIVLYAHGSLPVPFAHLR